MINIKEKSECTGCTACKSICPQKCIKMRRDEEGFLYPEIDKEKCVNCGLCEKVCPVKNTKKIEKKQQAYVFQNSDDEVRRESTSGGAFTAIAEYVIQKNGVVFGVQFDENFKVVHGKAETIEDLVKFRNSKYVQSEVGNAFEEVKQYLENGRMVCFSGTSCHIEGLKNFLRKDYENLILVDVVCRAVPSPLIWEKYLELKKKENSDIKNIRFRDKFYGYKYSNFVIFNQEDKVTYHRGVESDPYLRAFFSNICDRPACYDCKFKKLERESDITIWDCFNVEKYDSRLDDDKGTSRILANSEKGQKVMKELAIHNKVLEIGVKEATDGFLAIFQPVKENARRKEFFKDANQLESKELFEKYFPNTIKVRIERCARTTLVRTGIYKKILNLGKKFRKRD